MNGKWEIGVIAKIQSGGPRTESDAVDDVGVFSQVTKSDLKQLLSDLVWMKNLHINFVTVHKLTLSFLSFGSTSFETLLEIY